ncbi:hypothetical protein M514_25725 [Trichuris suis]|uniref:Uncharacterized protein n=1 Tax=Trichuris suis TaxID=68888 RepID=A0A085MY27_9BILA|nr:hypothetical protein M514_25725 [Trichuris suis]
MPGQAAAWNASECTFIAPLRVDVVHNDAFEAILTEIQQLHPPEPNTSHTSTMNACCKLRRQGSNHRRLPDSLYFYAPHSGAPQKQIRTQSLSSGPSQNGVITLAAGARLEVGCKGDSVRLAATVAVPRNQLPVF